MSKEITVEDILKWALICGMEVNLSYGERAWPIGEEVRFMELGEVPDRPKMRSFTQTLPRLSFRKYNPLMEKTYERSIHGISWEDITRRLEHCYQQIFAQLSCPPLGDL